MPVMKQFFSNQFTRFLGLCAIGLLLTATTAVEAATIGNVNSYSQSGQAVTFQISDGSKVQIVILADDLAKVRIAPSGTFEDNISQAVVNTSWPAEPYSLQDTGSTVTLSTAEMELRVTKSPFILKSYDAIGNLLCQDDPTRRIEWGAGYTRVHKTTQANEKYLGLGWRTHGLVRNGTRYHMRNVPTYEDPDTFYSGIPLWYSYRNGSVCGILFDDMSWGNVDLTTTPSGYMSFDNLGGTLEYYLFAGPTFADVLDRYTELTGRPFMPPKWSLGYQQCRWSYTPQSQVLNIANEFRARDIPCDVIYLDIDYMPGGHALTFDPVKFPDPVGMLSTLHSQGFRVVANISPMLFLDDPLIWTAQSNDYLLRKADGGILNGWHDYWYFVGGAGTGSLAWLDFSKTAARNWWANEHTSFIGMGIDGIWNDLNEPQELGDPWPADVKYNFDGNPVDHEKTGTQYALLQSDMSYDILNNVYPNRRPFVLSRGGCAGIQRSAALWSGDNTSDWVNHYKVNIPMGLSLSISGSPFNGHDIGGFLGSPDPNSKPSDELYTRWMQAGVFSPFCRQHHDGWGNKDPNRPFVEPWEFSAQTEAICKSFIELRYQLMPYLYTLFHEAHVSGTPIQRPTIYDFIEDTNTLTQDHDFMVGPHLLVSPVTSAGATTWSTYLPAGTNWINFWDDTTHIGGTNATTAAPMERLPIFVRAGAILPMAPVVEHVDEAPMSLLTMELYPDGDTYEYTLYEDDGLSWDYLSGQYCETTYTMSGNGNSFSLLIAARQGSYIPDARDYMLKVHRWPGHSKAPQLDGMDLAEYNSLSQLEAAVSGFYHDATANILYVKFADTGTDIDFWLSDPGIPIVPGDFNGDGDVDQADFAHMQVCLTGTGTAWSDPGCADADITGDGQIDGADVGAFVGCISGEGVLGDPTCTD